MLEIEAGSIEELLQLYTDGAVVSYYVSGVGTFYVLYESDEKDFNTDNLIQLEKDHPHRKAHLPRFNNDVVVFFMPSSE